MHLLGAGVSSDSEGRGLSLNHPHGLEHPPGSVGGRCLTPHTFPKHCPGQESEDTHRARVQKSRNALGIPGCYKEEQWQTQREQHCSLPQHVSTDRNYTKIGKQWDKSQIFDFTSQDSFLSPPLVTKPLVHTPTPSSKKQLCETNVIALKYTEAVTKHPPPHSTQLFTESLLCLEQDPTPPLSETLNSLPHSQTSTSAHILLPHELAAVTPSSCQGKDTAVPSVPADPKPALNPCQGLCQGLSPRGEHWQLPALHPST